MRMVDKQTLVKPAKEVASPTHVPPERGRRNRFTSNVVGCSIS